MFDRIRGKILEKTMTYVVVEAGGLGYQIHISLQTSEQLGDIGAEESLFLLYAVRTDSHQVTGNQLLYGFKTLSERSLFEKLISVSGIGLSTARLMLSSFEVSDLVNAIEQEQIKKLSSVKGIGEKSAQRLVVDLKDKLSEFHTLSVDKPMKKIPNEDVFLALQALGFAPKAIETALKRVQKEFPSLEGTDLILRKALQCI